MLIVKVTAGLTVGHSTEVAEVFGGTVRVDFVSRGEDDVDETLSVVTSEGFLSASVGLYLITLVGVESLAVKPELGVSKLVARVDALAILAMVLGAASVAVKEVVCAGGAKVFVGTVVFRATEEAVATAPLLAVIEVRGEGIEGLERGDVGFDVALAFPHSASTLAMTSPPPEIDSKVRREEMSASKELRLLSPGSIGGGVVGSGGTCSLALLTLSAVTRESTFVVGVVGVLSGEDKLWTGSVFSFSGLSRDRGWTLGVSVRSSLMISTLFAREDFSSGLGGDSPLSFDLSLTVPKRPFSPRR